MSDRLKPPRYALITSCQNEEAYMRKTLGSVVAQTQRAKLWFIVDDGSTDATPEILSEYASQHDWIRRVTKYYSLTCLAQYWQLGACNTKGWPVDMPTLLTRPIRL